ncbi:SMC-Scp complex subunit ScpB [Thalassotalea atypica]|uniref:SMC-Scp complex subunit ScpB n=1 Tax=Thalassotalea atypica TaxID=2054316 RepID=UPI0025742272|nr:SMC-Scp complex subunit ScpB [Thalassotalea atypica]
MMDSESEALPENQLKPLVEAAIFSAGKPVSIKFIKENLLQGQNIKTQSIVSVIAELTQDYHNRGVELVKLSNGYRFQTNSSLSEQLASMYNEKIHKTSPALMETLAIIAYKQPITRSEIEVIRGVAVSSHIVKTLTERQWIKVVGHKEVPGRPAMLGTTHEFLNYFSLDSLKQLPEIMPITESTATADLPFKIETEA